MVKGLYASALGMTTQMKKLDVISNNIANVNTTGFKSDGVITQSFSEEFLKHIDSGEGKNIEGGKKAIGKYSQGLFVDDVYTDFTSGSVKSTAAPLDLAITGSGFFTVMQNNAQGTPMERFSRDGSFTISSEGYLITKDGHYIQGQNGNIKVPSGNITISGSGEIYVNAKMVDTLKMVDFEDKTKLRKQGANLYSSIEEDNKTDFKGKIEQGFVETSNVNSVKEMVEMITVSRVYEANQKMIQTHDQTLSKAVSEIASK